jgi:urease accessory protein
MSIDGLLAVLRFADGLFPAGGFAHSFGLETYVQTGMVRDRAGLEEFLNAQLAGSVGPTDAVATACAARFAGRGDLDGWLDLDARLDATRWVPEFRLASRQMGRQTLRVALATVETPFLAALGRAVDLSAGGDGCSSTPAAGHHATVFGAALGCCGVEAEVAAAAYLHSAAVLVVNAALRLLPLGQVDGQAALAAVQSLIGRLAARAALASADDLWSFTPGLEIAGLHHADLDARLFRS